MTLENKLLGDVVAQRNAWRSCALGLGQALRRCNEDSKDFYAGRVPDRPWVQSNIEAAEIALAAFDQIRAKEPAQ